MSSVRPVAPGRKRSQRGNQLVEVALIFLPLCALLFGIFDFSVAIFMRATMQNAVREGVRYATEIKADLFVFTLDKTSGQFSPTTRYKDFAISKDLVHWESQSNLRANTETGQRYQNHLTMGTSIMLFARLRNDERSFW